MYIWYPHHHCVVLTKKSGEYFYKKIRRIFFIKIRYILLPIHIQTSSDMYAQIQRYITNTINQELSSPGLYVRQKNITYI